MHNIGLRGIREGKLLLQMPLGGRGSVGAEPVQIDGFGKVDEGIEVRGFDQVGIGA